VSSTLDRRGARQNRASGGPRLRACAQAGPPGGLVMGTRQHVCTLRGRPLQPASRRALRRQVSEPIGSGRSSRCEQSRRKAPGRAKAAWPLTRETSAGSLVGFEGDCAQARAPPGPHGRPLDMASRRRPAAGGRGSVSAGSRSRREGVVFQRQLPNAHVLTDGRGKGRGMVFRGSGGSIGRARGLC